MIAALALERFCVSVISNLVNFIHSKIRVVSAVKADAGDQEEPVENQSAQGDLSELTD